MIRRILRYKVRPSEIETAIAAIREFLIAVANTEQETRYEVLQLADNVSFLHIMQFASQTADEQHQKAHYTIKFIELLNACCEYPAEFTEVKGYFFSR